MITRPQRAESDWAFRKLLIWCLASWAALGTLAFSPAAEPSAVKPSAVTALPVSVPLPEGLSHPSAVVVGRVTSNGPEFYLADTQAQAVMRVMPTQGSEESVATVVLKLPGGSVTLGWLDDQTLLIATDQITPVRLQTDRPGDPTATDFITDSQGKSIQAVGTVTSMTSDSRYLFCLVEGALYRARHASGRLTELRKIAARENLAAIAMSPEGYLVFLKEAADEVKDAWQLEFVDPEHPGEPGVLIEVAGLAEPIAMLYGKIPNPTERLLYVLEAGDDSQPSGLYRVDALLPQGTQLRAQAINLAPIERPVAFAACKAGDLYLTALTSEKQSVLLRIKIAL